MHFDILVEDLSGRKALEILVRKIIADTDTYTINHYEGIGHLPKNLKNSKDISKRVLLNKLPRLIQGYGRRHAGYSAGYKASLIVVCDLDKKCLKDFRSELEALYSKCRPQPKTSFCIAVQEIEAWYLGDLKAVAASHSPSKITAIPAKYDESKHGNWELLADIIYQGGAAVLSVKSWSEIGAEKYKWALSICPHLDIVNNTSPSFIYFRDKLQELAGQ